MSLAHRADVKNDWSLGTPAVVVQKGLSIANGAAVLLGVFCWCAVGTKEFTKIIGLALVFGSGVRALLSICGTVADISLFLRLF